jgi:hypothetical protein
VAAAVLVVRVSSSAVRAWICRWIAAGFSSARTSSMIDLSSALTVGVSLGPLLRGDRDVVLRGDLRSVAGLADQLLLGWQVVGEVRLQSPDPVEQPHLGWRVEAVVADHGADDRPVLLLDVGAVVGVTRDGTG